MKEIKRIMLFLLGVVSFFCIFGLTAQFDVFALSISEDIKMVCDEYCKYCIECRDEIDQLEANIKNVELDSAEENIEEISLKSFIAMSSVEELIDKYNIEDTNIKCLRVNMVEIRNLLRNTFDDLTSGNVTDGKLFVRIHAVRAKFEFAHREAYEIAKSIRIKRGFNRYCRLCNACVDLISEYVCAVKVGNVDHILSVISNIKLKSVTAMNIACDIAYDVCNVDNINDTEFGNLYLVVDNLHDLSVETERYFYSSVDYRKKHRYQLKNYLNRLTSIADDLKTVSEKANAMSNDCLIDI